MKQIHDMLSYCLVKSSSVDSEAVESCAWPPLLRRMKVFGATAAE